MTLHTFSIQKISLNIFVACLLFLQFFSFSFNVFANFEFGSAAYGFCNYNQLDDPSCFNLTITKAANKTSANRGEQVTYTIGYSNQSSEDVPGVIIQDVLDSRLQFISCSGGASCSESAGTVSFNLGLLPSTPQVGSTGNVTIVAQVKNTASGVISNQASIDSDVTNPVLSSQNVDVTVTLQNPIAANDSASTNENQAVNIPVLTNDSDPDGTLATSPCSIIITQNGTQGVGAVNASTCTIDYTPNNNTTGSDEIRYTVRDADNLVSNVGIVSITINNTLNPIIAVTKVVDKTSALPNDTIAYTLNYGNTGSQGATNTIITDTLSSLVDYVASSCTNSCVVSTNGSGQTVLTWNIGTVATSGTGSVGFSVRVKTASTGNVLNQASIDSAETVASNSNQVVTSITVSTYTLSAVKSSNKTKVSHDEEITYTLTYQNTGNVQQTGVVVTDTISDLTNYVASSCSNSCVVSTNGSGQTVLTWNIGTLNANATGSVTFNAQVKTTSYGNISNSFSVRSTEYVGITSNTVQAVILLPSSNLPTIQITTPSTNVGSGATVDYTVKVTNSSPSILTNAVITTQLDANVDYVANSCVGCSFNSSTRTLTWNIATINQTEVVNLTFKLKTKIVPNLLTAVSIPTTVRITSDQTDGQTISSTVNVNLSALVDTVRTGGDERTTILFIFFLVLIAFILIFIQRRNFAEFASIFSQQKSK